MQTTKRFVPTSLSALFFTAFLSFGFASNAYGMQICQMTDTLVWDLEKGLDLSPADIEEFSDAYDVLVNDGVLYYWEYVESGVQPLTPIEFDGDGKAEHDDSLWFKVSETEFRIFDPELGSAWHSEITCPDGE